MKNERASNEWTRAAVSGRAATDRGAAAGVAGDPPGLPASVHQTWLLLDVRHKGKQVSRRILQAAGLGLAALLLAGCSGQQSGESAGQLQLERAAVIAPAAPPAPAPRPPAPRPPAPAPKPPARQAPAPARQAPAPARPPAPAAPRQQQPAPIIVQQDSGPSPWFWFWMLSQDNDNGQQCRKDG